MGGDACWGVDTLEVLLDKKGCGCGSARGRPGLVGRQAQAHCGLRARGKSRHLVLIACGFTGPEHGVFNAVGVPVAAAGRPLPVMAAEGCTSRPAWMALLRMPRRCMWRVMPATAVRSL